MPLHAHLNTFAGNPLDRAADRRRDPAWLAERLRGEARVLALWNGAPLLGPDDRLASVEPDLARQLSGEGERLLFLGLDGGTAVFALDLEGASDPSEGVLSGRGAFANLRDFAGRGEEDELGLAATAKAIFEWRRRHRFCSACGQASEVAEAGWKRICPACKVEHFPRTDPVVIMLPVCEERCLLGRQASWPPGRFSALAGFMEPGESIEAACAREIKEEAGLQVLSVSYHSSQPWPFPANLMIGLIAEVAPGEARPEDAELEAVRWLTRDETRRAIAGEGEVGLPPPLAIARRLIEHWAD
jgi:NAD+ diphosphatase